MSTLPTGVRSPESFGNTPDDYAAIFLKRIQETKAERSAALEKGNNAQAQSLEKQITELTGQYKEHCQQFSLPNELEK